MTLRFDKYVEQLQGLLTTLKSSESLPLADLSKFPKVGGCYALIDNGEYLYVGIAKNFRQRMRNHTSGRAEQSAFAFKLARESTGRATSYTQMGSRKSLMKDEVFASAMKLTTERVRKMKAQFVQIDDPSQRYLFEFFAAVNLESRYNDFNTH